MAVNFTSDRTGNDNGVTGIDASAFTLACAVNNHQGTLSANNVLFNVSASTDPDAFGAQIRLNTNKFPAFQSNFSTTDGRWEWQTAVTDDIWYMFVFTYDRSSTTNNARLFANGQERTLVEALTPVGTAQTGIDSAYVGGTNAGLVLAQDADICECLYWDRILSDDEALAVSAGFGGLLMPGGLQIYEPWWNASGGELIQNVTWSTTGAPTNAPHLDSLILPSPPLAIPSSAAVSFTLSAESGSYAITGTAAGVLFDRVIGADAGSYVLTGTAADLLFGRVITAASGSYATTGTVASLLLDRVIAASSGSYTVSGSAAGLAFDRVIGADGGVYAITGTAADLIFSGAGFLLSAEAGSYAVSGTDASLLFDRILVATAGSYLISGTDAGLIFDRLLDAATGSYVVTGSVAGLLHGRAVGAASGSYLITGSDATLVFSGAAAPTGVVTVAFASKQAGVACVAK